MSILQSAASDFEPTAGLTSFKAASVPIFHESPVVVAKIPSPVAAAKIPSPVAAAFVSNLEAAATTGMMVVIGRPNGGPRGDVGNVGVELER